MVNSTVVFLRFDITTQAVSPAIKTCGNYNANIVLCVLKACVTDKTIVCATFSEAYNFARACCVGIVYNSAGFILPKDAN